MNNKTATTVVTKIKSSLLGEEFSLVEHKSGLKIYVFYKDFSTYHAIFGTRYGSYDNRFRVKGETEITEVPEGIAHFLEHKMFDMSDGRDAFEIYAENGADANAYTGGDRTAYLFSCTDKFYENLRTLIKTVRDPYFTAETVKKEQGIIGEEIKMCEDRPWDAAYYGLMRAMYSESPVRIPVAGTVESIARITPELLYRCYNVFYSLKNMVLCVCGRVDADKVIAIADELLTADDGGEIERYIAPEAPKVCRPRETVRMQVSKPLFNMGVKEVTAFDSERCRKELIRTLLCETVFGMSSPLYSELYESGTVGGYGASWVIDGAHSFLNIYGDSDEPEKVFEKVTEYVESCKRDGIPEEDFVRSKRVLYARTVRSFESATDISEEMFDNFISGSSCFEFVELISHIEKRELEEVLRSTFNPESYAMCVLLPKEA